MQDRERERLARLKEISGELGGRGSVQEFSEHLFKKRSWGPMAESETYAHLEHLRHAGEASRFEEDRLYRYEL